MKSGVQHSATVALGVLALLVLPLSPLEVLLLVFLYLFLFFLGCKVTQAIGELLYRDSLFHLIPLLVTFSSLYTAIHWGGLWGLQEVGIFFLLISALFLHHPFLEVLHLWNILLLLCLGEGKHFSPLLWSGALLLLLLHFYLKLQVGFQKLSEFFYLFLVSLLGLWGFFLIGQGMEPEPKPAPLFSSYSSSFSPSLPLSLPPSPSSSQKISKKKPLPQIQVSQPQGIFSTPKKKEKEPKSSVTSLRLSSKLDLQDIPEIAVQKGIFIAAVKVNQPTWRVWKQHLGGILLRMQVLEICNLEGKWMCSPDDLESAILPQREVRYFQRRKPKKLFFLKVELSPTLSPHILLTSNLWRAEGLPTLIRGASENYVTSPPYRKPLRYNLWSEAVFLENPREWKVGKTDRLLLYTPPSLREMLKNMAQRLTQKASSPYEKILLLVRHFRKNYTYTLTPHLDPQNPLMDFFQAKRGYCQHFASALALLLRSLGIPSRIAIGFKGTKYNQGTVEIYSENAHAWTEAYFQPVGWVPFDATPPSFSLPLKKKPDIRPTSLSPISSQKEKSKERETPKPKPEEPKREEKIQKLSQSKKTSSFSSSSPKLSEPKAPQNQEQEDFPKAHPSLKEPKEVAKHPAKQTSQKEGTSSPLRSSSSSSSSSSSPPPPLPSPTQGKQTFLEKKPQTKQQKKRLLSQKSLLLLGILLCTLSIALIGIGYYKANLTEDKEKRLSSSFRQKISHFFLPQKLSPKEKVVWYFEKLSQELHKYHLSRKPEETGEEYLARLSPLVSSTDSIHKFLELFLRARYTPLPIKPEEAQKAKECMWEILKQIQSEVRKGYES